MDTIGRTLYILCLSIGMLGVLGGLYLSITDQLLPAVYLTMLATCNFIVALVIKESSL